jgi:hypothetical protein
MRHLVIVIAAVLAASGATAQETNVKTPKLSTINRAAGDQGGMKVGAAKGASADAPGGEATMAELVAKGYEIKAAVPNGGKFIVFMQKDQSAYACEFQSLAGTRCGSIN